MTSSNSSGSSSIQGCWVDGGKQSKVTLERNDFATFSGDSFSFVHPSGVSVTKTDLGENITQYLMASALGTIIVVQEYGKMNPVSLNH